MRNREWWEKTPDLQGKYATLPASAVNTDIQRIGELLTAGRLTPAITEGQPQQTDTADLRPEEVRRVLLSYLAGKPSVTILWPADRAGILINYHDFVRHYDDLWYPARDDLWITDDTFAWLIELSHEEVVTLLQQTPKVPAPTGC